VFGSDLEIKQMMFWHQSNNNDNDNGNDNDNDNDNNNTIILLGFDIKVIPVIIIMIIILNNFFSNRISEFFLPNTCKIQVCRKRYSIKLIKNK